jgi:hypothetical protein
MNGKMVIKKDNGLFNCYIVNNILISDSNDSSNWTTVRLTLPEPVSEWNIDSSDGSEIVLIDK